MRKSAAAISILLLLAIATVPAWGISGELVIEGTGDSQSLLRELSGHFTRVYSSVGVVVPDSVGSTGGIDAVKKKEIELARTARALTAEEQRDGLVEVVFARSPVVFVVHPGVKGIDNITTEQAVAIYSGKITWWDELGGDHFRVYPVGREPGDSSRRIIEAKLTGFRGMERGGMVKTAFTAPEVVEIIKGHKNTIGYMPLAAAYKSGLKVLKLNGVEPTVDNVKNGTYPLVVPLGIVHRGELSPSGKAFVDFLFGADAQAVITEYGSLPAIK